MKKPRPPLATAGHVGRSTLIHGSTLRAFLAACFILAAAAGPAAAQQVRSTKDLGFFIGRWEGESSFLPAFTPGALPRPEAIRSQCDYVLAGAYIQCNLVLTNSRGRERGVMHLFNFNEVSGDYEGLTLASNFGEESSYILRWDGVEKGWVGHLPAMTADGRKATERLVYTVSQDGGTIRLRELIRPDDPPDGPWVQTYRSLLRKVPQERPSP